MTYHDNYITIFSRNLMLTGQSESWILILAVWLVSKHQIREEILSWWVTWQSGYPILSRRLFLSKGGLISGVLVIWQPPQKHSIEKLRTRFFGGWAHFKNTQDIGTPKKRHYIFLLSLRKKSISPFCHDWLLM